MVYCNLVSETNESATYIYGGSLSDMTGEFTFSRTPSPMVIIKKEPQKVEVWKRHFDSMLRRHKKELISGKYPQKMSYEI